MLSIRDKPKHISRTVLRRKWWMVPLLFVAVVGSAGFIGVKVYRRVEPVRLATRAKAMMETGDFRSAAVTLTRAIQINSNSEIATRTMADLVERLQKPNLLEWRQRVAELNPDSLPDALSWANLALRAGKTDVAERALQSVAIDQRGNAQWHATAGLTAIRSGKWQAAREHFLEATRIEPENDMYRYNLALVQIQSPNAEERANGFATLDQPGLQGRVEIFAHRAVIVQLVREGKIEEALSRSTLFVAKPQAEVLDHTTHLDLLRKAGRTEWPNALANAQLKASERPADVAVLLQWLRMRGLGEDSLTWAGKLPETIGLDPVVQAARGECLSALQRWEELREFAKPGDWGVANWRRMALLAKALSELDDEHGAISAWDGAVRLASVNQGQLAGLSALASAWDWKLQMREVLWVAAGSTSPDWALRTLHTSYLADGDTEGLLRVARRQVTLDPVDIRARNNVAQCSLLLKMYASQSLALAKQLAKEAPGDNVILSTLAFAFLVNNRTEDALLEIEKIPLEQRRQPSIALYYGLILQARGDVEKAREYLLLTDDRSLLPEEKRLRDEALAG